MCPANFYVAAGNKDGYRNACIPCVRGENKQGYEGNRDAARAKHREWKEKNKPAYLSQQRQSYRQNHTTERAKRNARRTANVDKYRQIESDYHKKNKHTGANASAKRRATKRAVTVEAVDRRVVHDRDKGICYLCQEAVTLDEMHLEHVIPLANSGEHSYDNVRTSCAPCNLRKGTKPAPRTEPTQ